MAEATIALPAYLLTEVQTSAQKARRGLGEGPTVKDASLLSLLERLKKAEHDFQQLVAYAERCDRDGDKDELEWVAAEIHRDESKGIPVTAERFTLRAVFRHALLGAVEEVGSLSSNSPPPVEAIDQATHRLIWFAAVTARLEED
jgi:hypothetical protein